MDLQDLIEDFQNTGPIPEWDDEYKKTIRKLDGHFKTEENFPLCRRLVF